MVLRIVAEGRKGESDDRREEEIEEGGKLLQYYWKANNNLFLALTPSCLAEHLSTVTTAHIFVYLLRIMSNYGHT